MTDYPKPRYAKDAAEGQVRKQEFIKESQNATQMSIRVSSSLTNAVNIATARDKFKTMTDKEIDEEIKKWRKWVFELMDINETYKNLTQPFV